MMRLGRAVAIVALLAAIVLLISVRSGVLSGDTRAVGGSSGASGGAVYVIGNDAASGGLDRNGSMTKSGSVALPTPAIRPPTFRDLSDIVRRPDAGVQPAPRRLAAVVDGAADKQELERRAAACEVRYDVPGAKSDVHMHSLGWASDEDLAALGLSQDELEIAKAAITRYKSSLTEMLQKALSEIEGPQGASVSGLDIDELEARVVTSLEKARPGELRRGRREVARDLAGQVRSDPSAQRSLGERLYRQTIGLADEFQRDLERDAGSQRAAELRGMLSGRQVNAGCPAVP